MISSEFNIVNIVWADSDMKDSKIISELYDIEVKIPLTKFDSRHWSRQAEYPWAILNSEIKSGDKILNAGSGTGVFGFYLSRFGHVVNLDFIPAVADEGMQLVARNVGIEQISTENITFAVGSMCSIPYSDGFFDKVFCISTLEHVNFRAEIAKKNIPDTSSPELEDCLRIKAFNEMLRILKPGGILMLTVDVAKNGISDSELSDILKSELPPKSQSTISAILPDSEGPIYVLCVKIKKEQKEQKVEKVGNKMGIGVTTYGDYRLTDNLLTSIITKTGNIRGKDYEIVVIDDGTQSLDIIVELENVCRKHNVKLILNGKNKGVCYSRNKLVQSLDTELITIFSNDITILRSDWLKNVTYFLIQNEKIGVVNFSVEQRIPTGTEIYPKNVADIGGSVFSIKKSVYNEVINPDGSVGFWENLNAFLEDTHFAFSLIELGYYNYMLNSGSDYYMMHETSSTFNKYPELMWRSVDWKSIEREIDGSKEEFINTVKKSKFYSDESKVDDRIIFSFRDIEHVNKLQLSRYMFSKYWEIEHDDELSMRHDELAKRLFGKYENLNQVKYLSSEGEKSIEMITECICDNNKKKQLIYGVTRCLYGEDFVQQAIKSIDPMVDKIFVFWDDTSWGDVDHCIYKGKRIDFPKKFDNTVDKIKELNNPKVILIYDHNENNIGQYTHQVNDLILPYYPRPDYLLFFEVDMVFRSDQLKKAFDEFIGKDYLLASTSQIEMWYDLKHRIPDRYRIGPIIWNMKKIDKLPPTFRQGGEMNKIPPFLNAYNHNFGLAVSPKVLYWKHMLTIASSPIIGDSIPNEDWYEETWLKWDYNTNNKNLEVAKDAGFEIQRANHYDYTQLPEVILEDFIKKGIFKIL